MADTLIDVVKRVLRATGQDTDISAFSDNDDTQFIVDQINEGLLDLHSLGGGDIILNGTLTVTPSTRLFSVATGLDIHEIEQFSWRINNALGDIPLKYVTREYIISRYPLFEAQESETPEFVYYEAQKAGFYPLLKAGASNLTIQYSYLTTSVRLSATTDTFPYPDKWVQYAQKYAQGKYEIYKGLGQPAVTAGESDSLYTEISVKIWKEKRIGFKPYRSWG